MSALPSPSKSPTPFTCQAEIGHGTNEPLARLDGHPIHRIELVLAARAVSPQDVRFAVAVEVSYADDAPSRVGNRPQIALRCFDREPIHQIEVVLPRDRIPPQDVVLAIAIEVAYAHDLPALIG